MHALSPQKTESLTETEPVKDGVNSRHTYTCMCTKTRHIQLSSYVTGSVCVLVKVTCKRCYTALHCFKNAFKIPLNFREGADAMCIVTQIFATAILWSRGKLHQSSQQLGMANCTVCIVCTVYTLNQGIRRNHLKCVQCDHLEPKSKEVSF